MLTERFCQCAEKYVWNEDETQCIVQCSAIENAIHPRPDGVDPNVCECQEGYLWNSEEISCDLIPIDCSQFPLTIEREEGVPEDECSCRRDFEWSKVRSQCIHECELHPNYGSGNLKTGIHKKCIEILPEGCGNFLV